MVDKSNVNWPDIRHETEDMMLDLTHLYRHTLDKLGLEQEIPAVDPFKLSRREKECLHWTGAGKTAPEIAIILGLSTEDRSHVSEESAVQIGSTYHGTGCH